MDFLASFNVDASRLRSALRTGPSDPLNGVTWLDCDDDDELRDLQARIEQGRRFELVGPPDVEGATTRAPIREGSA